MELLHIPQQQELNSLYGSWNPMAYIQGMENQGLQGMFNQQAQTLNDQAIRKGNLENDQSEQMNPLLLAHQSLLNEGKVLTNRGSDLSNQSAQIDLDKKSYLAGQDRETAMKELKLKYSDAQIAEMSNNVLQEHLNNVSSGNIAGMRKTGPLLEFLAGATAGKVADRAQDRYRTDSTNQMHITTTGMNNRSAMERLQAEIDAGKYKKRDPASVAVWSQKFSAMNPATRLGVTWSALESGLHPFTGEQLTDEERKVFQAYHDQDQATVDAGNQSRAGGAQGVAPSVDKTGKVVIQDRAPVSAAPKGVTEGTTKSGAKFKVIQTP